MKNSPYDREELRRLANNMADGTASRSDAEQLSTLLRERVDLRDEYLAFLETHAALCCEYRDQVDAASGSSAGNHAEKTEIIVYEAVRPW